MMSASSAALAAWVSARTMGAMGTDHLEPPLGDAKLDASAPWAALMAAADTAMHDGGPDALFSCEALFAERLLGGAARETVLRMLARLARDPGYVPPGDRNRGELSLARGQACSLVLRVISPGSAERWLSALPVHQLIGVVGPGPLCVERFRRHAVDDNDVFDRSLPLVFEGRHVVPPGAVVKVRACEEVVRLAQGTSIEPKASPNEGAASAAAQKVVVAVMATASSAKLAHIIWRYDPETLLGHHAAAADADDSRLEFAAQLLSEMGHPDSAEAVARLCDHPAHFVRWSALRALLDLDWERGVTRLEQATVDPHPHVRDAARRALERLAAPRRDEG